MPLESFETILGKEIERSRRYYRGFGIMRVRAAVERATEWQRIVPGIVRRADLVAADPAGTLYILLPETPASGMPAVTRRLEEALAQSDVFTPPEGVTPEISQAAYPRDGETAGELLGALREGH
jgi:hypothetical protein